MLCSCSQSASLSRTAKEILLVHCLTLLKFTRAPQVHQADTYQTERRWWNAAPPHFTTKQNLTLHCKYSPIAHPSLYWAPHKRSEQSLCCCSEQNVLQVTPSHSNITTLMRLHACFREAKNIRQKLPSCKRDWSQYLAWLYLLPTSGK